MDRLKPPEDWPENAKEDFEEYASKLEYMAGMTRTTAEQRALEMVKARLTDYYREHYSGPLPIARGEK